MSWFIDKTGAYNLDEATVVQKDREGKAILHVTGGGFFQTDTAFDAVLALVSPRPEPVPAPEPPKPPEPAAPAAAA